MGKSGFAAGGSGPVWFRTYQPDTGAVGVEVDLVLGRVQRVDVGAGEELRRPVRALGHRKFPARVYRRNMLGGNSSRDPGRLSEFENVSCPQSPTFVSPEPAQGEGRRTAEIVVGLEDRKSVG